MRYRPNPAHKRETSEAGPPRWRPDKSLCPAMTIEDREILLRESIPENPNDGASRRYAVRITSTGPEWFVACAHSQQGDEVEFHGYPVTHVPAQVLRRFRDRGAISEAEYRRLVRQLG